MAYDIGDVSQHVWKYFDYAITKVLAEISGQLHFSTFSGEVLIEHYQC